MANIIGLIVVGLVIGLLARLFLPGRQRIGILMTMLLGVVGAVIAGLLVSQIGAGSVFELNVPGFIAAVVVSVVLLAIGERMGLGAGAERDRLGPGR